MPAADSPQRTSRRLKPCRASQSNSPHLDRTVYNWSKVVVETERLLGRESKPVTASEMVSTQTPTQWQLTEDIALPKLRAFFDDKPFVFFGTGMSCALDTRFGMAALKDELLQKIQPDCNDSVQIYQWERVANSLEYGNSLESALDEVSDSRLLQHIISTTGRFLSCIDRAMAIQISTSNVKWPATSLLKGLVETLPDGDPILHVLTPNYDTLFEHACDSVGVPYANGFAGGIERQMDWPTAKYTLLQRQQVRHGRHLKTIHKYRKHARIYKVHGSLNFFFHRHKVIENNTWMWDAPDFAERVMITPGLSKHEMLQKHRQELLTPADEAIDRANRFLFLGYGFNDTHLETYITQKLITQACKGLILTRDSNPRIELLLRQAQNLWLVCKAQQDGVDGTRISNTRYKDCLFLPTERLWDIRAFTTKILGYEDADI